MHAARNYLFGDVHAAEAGDDCSLLNAFLLFVRYPRLLRSQEVAHHLESIEKIRAILTPFPNTRAQVFRAALAVYEVFQFDRSVGPSRGLLDFLSGLGRLHGVPPAPAAASHRTAGGRRLRQTPDAEDEARIAPEVIWATATPNRSRYLTELAAVKPHVQKLRRQFSGLMAPECGVIQGTSSGILDRRRLYRVRAGGRVFERHLQAPDRRRLTVVLLIDESGSMKGRKIIAARRTAVLFQEALSGIPHVRTLIYGHTADVDARHNTVVRRYYGSQRHGRFLLGDVAARNNNRDGTAIAAVGREVCALAHGDEIVLIVISDGHPRAKGYHGDAAVEHTRRAVASIEKQGVRVIQIAIDPAVESERMFKHHIRMTGPSRLPAEMAQLLRRLFR